MVSEYRVDELERRNNNHGRSLSSLSSRLAAVEQLANMLSAGGGGTFGGGGGSSIRVGKASGAITASTATTPGSGTVQPLKIDGGAYADDGATVAVRNAGAAISTGKRGFVIRIGTEWWFTPEEC